MKRSDKVFGVVIATIIIVTVSLNIISRLDPSKREVQPIDEDDPFDTTELSKSYIYDHSQIKNP